ncbi:MAG: PAS domain S-box protein [Balneolaceae bacterium]
MDRKEQWTTAELNLIDAIPGMAAIIYDRGAVQRVNRDWNAAEPDGSGFFGPKCKDSNYLELLASHAEGGDDDALKLLLGIRDVISGRRTEFRMSYSVGQSEEIWYRATIRPMGSGEEHFLVIHEDISDIMNRSRHLNETRDLYRQQFLYSKMGIALLSRNEGLVEANPAAREMLGYSGGELLSGALLYDPENMLNRDALDTLGKVGEFEGEMVFTTYDGEEFPAEVTCKYYRGPGGEIQTIFMFRDISAERSMEEENLFTFELMSKLFEYAPMGLLLIDRNNEVERVNGRFSEMFGYSKEELVGRSADRLITPDALRDEANRFTERVFNGQSFQEETVRVSKSGREIPVLLGAVPVVVGQEVEAAFGLYVDINERVRLEEKVRELLENEREARQEIEKRLKEREILLQEVHHRVKNNLALIAGLLDLQIMDQEDDFVNSKLREVQRRIFSIARIHESIYQKEDVVSVDLAGYFHDVAGSYEPDNRPVVLNLGEVHLNLNQAVTCGLLLNELLSMVEATERPESEAVKLTLQMKENNQVEMHIENPGFEIDSKDGKVKERFNLTIIRVLMQQLKAEFTFVNKPVSRMEIHFMKANVRGSSSRFFV